MHFDTSITLYFKKMMGNGEKNPLEQMVNLPKYFLVFQKTNLEHFFCFSEK